MNQERSLRRSLLSICTDYTESHITLHLHFIYMYIWSVVEQDVRYDDSDLLWNHFMSTGGVYDFSVSIERGGYHMAGLVRFHLVALI